MKGVPVRFLVFLLYIGLALPFFRKKKKVIPAEHYHINHLCVVLDFYQSLMVNLKKIPIAILSWMKTAFGTTLGKEKAWCHGNAFQD
jgi:hypothetical protein